MNNSSISSHSSHAIPQLHGEDSSIGVTNLLKDTGIRNRVQQMVDDYEHRFRCDGANEPLPKSGSMPLTALEKLTAFKQMGSGHVDNSQLPLHDAKATPPVKSKDAFDLSRAREVVIYPGVRQVSEVQQPGLIARTRTSCLSFFQRCFGRTTR